MVLGAATQNVRGPSCTIRGVRRAHVPQEGATHRNVES
jgi:hypothetical protein